MARWAFALLALCLAACDLARPWQPNGHEDPATNPQIQVEAAKARDGIGDYNQIPSSLVGHERALLEAFARVLPRGSDFRVWVDNDDATKIRKLGLRSLSQTTTQACLEHVHEYSSESKHHCRRIELYRSARFTPASWDLDVNFSRFSEANDILDEARRILVALAATPLQGRVYLDDLRVEAGRVKTSLRDRRARTGVDEEAETLRHLRETYPGVEVAFSSRDVVENGRVKQRIYDIEIEGYLRGLPQEDPEGGNAKALSWSPEGGPRHNPSPADNDANRRLIERENAKYR